MRLSERAEHADMELVVDGDDDAIAVEANVAAVEQILFNLVDNACKYAAGATDRRVHLEIAPEDGKAELRVRDHGPGISASVRRRLHSRSAWN